MISERGIQAQVTERLQTVCLRDSHLSGPGLVNPKWIKGGTGLECLCTGQV